VSETLGVYELEAAHREDANYAWHSARRSDGEGPPLLAKVALGPETAQALARETRLAARLSEQTPAIPRPVDWVRDGYRRALVMVAPEGEALGEGALELASVLRVADALADLDYTLVQSGLTFQPTPADLLVGAKGVWVTGLERLRPALAADGHEATRRWGRLVAGLLGEVPGDAEVDFEALSRTVPPLVLDMLRAALEGRGYPRELIAELKAEVDAAPSPASRARRAASFGLGETVSGPQGPLYLACREGESWLAIDPRLDAVVRLSSDRAEWGTRAPEAVVLPPPAPLVVADPEPPPRLLLRRRPEGAVLQLKNLALHTEAVVLVRRRGEGPLLVPEDGEVLVTLEGVTLEEPFTDAGAAPGDRYAAFPLFGDVPGLPGRASL